MSFDWFVTGEVLIVNPAHAMRMGAAFAYKFFKVFAKYIETARFRSPAIRRGFFMVARQSCGLAPRARRSAVRPSAPRPARR